MCMLHNTKEKLWYLEYYMCTLFNEYKEIGYLEFHEKNLAFSCVQTLIVHMYSQLIVYKVDIGS